jgi:prepilin-type N-terminal cleavage/methylation domain-containing protein
MGRKNGFTLVELAIVITLLAILSTLSLLMINPVLMKRKSRDVVRLADLGTLLQAIESYTLDHGVPPEEERVLRRSDTSVSEGQAPQLSDGRGWLGTDLSSYLPKLPTDPENVWPKVYRYLRVGDKFEIDAYLEDYTDMMREDGGNDEGWYERGTDLTIL